jgi:hypothetical protein
LFDLIIGQVRKKHSRIILNRKDIQIIRAVALEVIGQFLELPRRVLTVNEDHQGRRQTRNAEGKFNRTFNEMIMSVEREILEYISAGNLAWAPADNSDEAADHFNEKARRLMESLDRLIGHGFIGNYRAHVESYSGKRRIDRILITEGLTFKGQDRSTWPE